MKKSQILATTWLTGLPLIMIFTASQIIFSHQKTKLTWNVKSSAHAQMKLPLINPDSSAKIILPKLNCSHEKVIELIQKAKNEKGKRSMVIDCNLKLGPRYRITKKLIFEGVSATGVTLDCNGAMIDGGKSNPVHYGADMIEVRSLSDTAADGTRWWKRPQNVTIKNCKIVGSVRIWGMAKNGEGTGSVYETSKRRYDISKRVMVPVEVNFYKESSRKAGHIFRARDRAPRNIVLSDVTISGVGRSPLYFSPGVTESKLINSTINGMSDAAAIYLDAESSNNSIKYNRILTKTVGNYSKTDDPLIAIDGSSYNEIIGNEFSSLEHGGIYIYRNCGLNGVVRHSSPSRNRIISNTFYYKDYKGSYYVNGVRYGNPAVWIGSRSDGTMAGFPILGYCDDDDGFPFGSSKSDWDNATYNTVRSNKIYKLESKNVIIVSRKDINSHNIIEPNPTVK